jgi:hypothetical protein
MIGESGTQFRAWKFLISNTSEVVVAARCEQTAIGGKGNR